MWQKSYRDYPKDKSLKKEQVQSGKGLVGCEMHELNGWGESYHVSKSRKRGVIYHFLHRLFGDKE